MSIGKETEIYYNLPIYCDRQCLHQCHRTRHQILLPLLIIHLLLITISNSLDICTENMACRVRLSQFALIERDYKGDSSGWSSGIDEPLIYDEFHSPSVQLDLFSEANITQTEICKCSNGNDCSFNQTENTTDLDRTISLAFCSPINELFNWKCNRYASRNYLRVIGEIDETGEQLRNVSEVFVFCLCPNGYQRMLVEQWFGDLFAFVFKCS
ncbi:unnamed protein product [Dracunculus medinensis]|uniref:WAK_assoc domain-containing protein n=1 Tax=Dracunculus medinensis TaxID=318479 RepID=A0A0N4U8P8_DRAME|nr:unnamed protein product [Dracunculus medinensis]